MGSARLARMGRCACWKAAMTRLWRASWRQQLLLLRAAP